MTYILSTLIPVGGITAWHKNFSNTPSLPDGWVEANGQVLSDVQSVYNGQTIPDLNGSIGVQMYLRGNSVSGGMGGSKTHTHAITRQPTNVRAGASSYLSVNTDVTDSAGNDPPYFEVVFVMRIR